MRVETGPEDCYRSVMEEMKEEIGQDKEKTPTARLRIMAFLFAFAAFVVGIMAGIYLAGGETPQYWEQVTRHSDRPSQVLAALDSLEKELAKKHNFYITEIHYAEQRAIRKADESRQGIGEPGETIDDAKREELRQLAPEWDRVRDRATKILARYAVRE